MKRNLSVIFKFLLLIYFQAGNSEIVSAQSIDTNQTQLPDLWRSNIDVYPGVVNPGSFVTVFSTVHNWGNSKAEPSLTYYYLSNDTIAKAPYDTLQGFEYYLSNSFVGSLEPGMKYLDSAGFQIPQFITPGDYYLHIRTDAGDSIQESNEYNNLAIVKIKIGSGIADLQPDSLSFISYDFAPGSFVEGQFLVRNIGDGPANGHFSGFYLSSDSILDNSDTLVGDSYSYWIDAGSVGFSNANIHIPSGTQPGEYYLIAQTDYLNNVAESNETNNTLVRRINIHKLDADLSIVGYDSTVSYYGNANIYGYIHNQGTTISLPTDVAFYLSRDRNLDSSDINVGMDYIPGINPNEERSYKYGLYVGSDDNYHYLITKVDNSNINPESNEENNLLFTFINYVKPDVDLQIEDPRIYDSSLVSGSSATVSYIVKNTGSTSSSYYTYTNFYVSKDTILSSDDYYAGYNYDGLILGDSSLYNKGIVYLPYDINTGRYFIIFHTDAYNYTAETNEDNNYAYAPIDIVGPNNDLAIQNLAISSNIVQLGGSIGASFNDVNLGNTYVPYHYTTVVLSSDSVYGDSSDIYLGSYYAKDLSPNQSYSYYQNVYVGNNIPAGDYFLIFKADGFNQMSESNEYNNIAFSKVKLVAPNVDLSVKTPRVSQAKVVAGNTVNLSGYLYNSGKDYSFPTYMNFYLSKSESSLDSSSVYYISTAYIEGVAPEAYLTFNHTATIPSYIPAGEYYVIFKADDYNYQPETNESNNSASKKITIEAATVDISVKSASVKSKITVEQTVSVKTTVSNTGNTDAPFFTLGYYLSNDENYSSDDIYLGTSNVFGILYKSSVPVSGEIVIPYFVQAGTYKLLLVADNYNYVYETNENNNVLAKSIEVKNPHYPTDSIINPGNDTIVAPPILPKPIIAISVAPNPASDIINAHIQTTENSKTAEYELYDSFGLKSKSGIINTENGSFSIPAFDLSPGIYLLKVSYGGTVETIRVYKD